MRVKTPIEVVATGVLLVAWCIFLLLLVGLSCPGFACGDVPQSSEQVSQTASGEPAQYKPDDVPSMFHP